MPEEYRLTKKIARLDRIRRGCGPAGLASVGGAGANCYAPGATAGVAAFAAAVVAAALRIPAMPLIWAT